MMPTSVDAPIFVNERLLAHWERAGDRRLICIQAPGGFGKTTAAAWWVGKHALPVIWMRLEREPACRHVPTFLSVLAAKLAATAGMEPPVDCHLLDCAALARKALPAGFCLVLDDYHRIGNPDLDHLISDLVRDLPGLACLVLASRQALTLPHLVRQVAHREALLLQESDLRLDAADIAQCLQVPQATADELYRRTEGWFFALNLALEVRHLSPSLAARAFDVQLASYLLDEILAPLPADLVSFMQITALMESFTREDCLALELPGAETAIQQLDRDRLFLQHLDGAFTYHALIRQALVERLPLPQRRTWHLRIGDYLVAEERQAGLPHLLAAKAWPQASRAIAWFHLTQWLETAQAKPTLTYWFQELSGEDLQDDPWYLLLYWLLEWRHMANEEQASLLVRIASLFGQHHDPEGVAVALYYRWRHHHRLADYETCRALLPEVVAARDTFEARHPVAQMCQDLLIEHHSYIEANRQAWEEAVTGIFALPPVTPYIRQRQLHNRIRAMDRFTTWGEFATALRHLRGAAAVLRSARATAGYVVGYQAILASHIAFEPVVPPAEAAMILAEETAREPQFQAVSLYCRASDAWNAGRWEDAGADLAATVTLAKTTTNGLWPDIFTMARLRLGRLRQQQGDLAGAYQLYREAEQEDGSEYEIGNVWWHLATVERMLGRDADARQHIQQAEDYARQHDLKFLLAKVLVLRAIIRQEPPSDEAVDLVAHGDYDHALQVQFPEGWALLVGLTPASPSMPRIQIRSFGGFQVWVDGREVTWKRSNSQLVLIDLLLHPTGSTAKQLEQRYWPGVGNPGLRADIYALRRLLEPDMPGKESRYVMASGRHYRWNADPNLVWWDVASYERACHKALTSSSHVEAEAARQTALSLYRGPFLPGMDAYPTVTDRRTQLQRSHQRLTAGRSD